MNNNHPKKGSNITVEPIRELDDIHLIKRGLIDKPRDYLLFTLGINTGMRVSDILALQIKDVQNLKEGDALYIIEIKTRKPNIIYINKTTCSAIQRYLRSTNHKPNDWLFKSRKGQNTSLSVSSVHRMIGEWTTGIKGNYGTNTMRKTWGYHQRITYGVGYDVICKRYGHESPSTTMRYIGITEDEVINILKNEL